MEIIKAIIFALAIMVSVVYIKNIIECMVRGTSTSGTSLIPACILWGLLYYLESL